MYRLFVKQLFILQRNVVVGQRKATRESFQVIPLSGILFMMQRYFNVIWTGARAE